jgi:uncharacterized protein (TIGR02421 family)
MPDTTQITYDLPTALARLDDGDPLDLLLPGGGKLHLARPVPFLTVYRYGAEANYALHAEEAAYAVVRENEPLSPETEALLDELLRAMADRFGGALLLEVVVDEATREAELLISATTDRMAAIRDALADHLGRMQTDPKVTLRHADADAPPGLLRIPAVRERRDIQRLSVVVNGFFLDEEGTPFPLVLRDFRQGLHLALRRTFFDFVRLQTTYNATHFHQLGNHLVSDLVWDIDRRLVDISTSFRFLMLVTATNDDEAFREFTGNGYRGEPNFRYRFLPVDPEALMRDLLNLPIDEVRDATLAYILRDKRDETFRMLDMLANRGNENFRYGSMQVFGDVDDDLLSIAESLLTMVPPVPAGEKRDTLPTEQFVEQCRREFDYLTEQYPTAEPRAELRTDFTGLMVSQGVLNVGHTLRVPRHRAEALIQHEVGTHVLTYWNGRAQPLTLLHSGTPGYENLQEGLAVLSEWFVDGLTGPRFRVLAGRVVGIAHMLRGHSFQDTFSLLHEQHGIPARSAFYTTARIYRGGGFTKDAVYLRGLVELLEYLGRGGGLEPLLIGKLRLDYVPLLGELRERGILRPPPLTPRYLREDRAAGSPKLNRLRAGLTVFDLIPRTN